MEPIRAHPPGSIADERAFPAWPWQGGLPRRQRRRLRCARNNRRSQRTGRRWRRLLTRTPGRARDASDKCSEWTTKPTTSIHPRGLPHRTGRSRRERHSHGYRSPSIEICQATGRSSRSRMTSISESADRRNPSRSLSSGRRRSVVQVALRPTRTAARMASSSRSVRTPTKLPSLINTTPSPGSSAREIRRE